jgi:signal transduction histidine kinase
VFRFSASNREGIWSDQVLAVPFEVMPAYWQTAWFRLAVLLVFAGAVAGGVRYYYLRKLRRKVQKLAQAHAIEQERMRIARDIHDDLGARLTQVALLGEMASSESGLTKQLGDRLEKIAHGSREAIRSLEEIVWAVNPSKDSLPQFVDYLSHHANGFFRGSTTRCRQDLPLIIPDFPLATDVRHHLFLACKEALNNVFKHAQAKVVWLRLNLDGADLGITIEDDGQGFSPRGAGSGSAVGGNGLVNMKNRIETIGGHCEVDSGPGRGTRVCFHVRLSSTSVPTKPGGKQSSSTS